MRASRRPSSVALASLALAALAAAASAQAPRDDPFGRMFGEERRVDDDSDLPEEPLARALDLARRGRKAEAEGLLRALVAAESAAPGERLEPLVALARLLLDTGRAGEAAALADRAREVGPSDPRPALLRGRLAERRGDLGAAQVAYRAALGFAPPARGVEHLEALVRLGRLEREAFDPEEGARLLERALEVYQARPKLEALELVWVARACLALDVVPAVKKQYSKRMVVYARDMLDQALAADPRCVEAHVEGGVLALGKYDAPAAKKALERACALDPNDADARVGLARALLQSFYAGTGRFGDASANLQKALSADPTHPGAHATLAAIAITDGDYAAALDHVATGLAEHPADVDLLAMRATVHLVQADEAAFAAAEREVLARRPRCARFYEAVSGLVTLKFRYAEARDLARKALQVDPGWHPVLATLGISLTRTGDEEEGRRVLKLAFEEDPYNVYTFNTLELFDRVERGYVTVEGDGFIVRLDAKEAEVSARYVLDLCREAKAYLSARYGAFPETVLVELFSKHADFSARSVGLPGIPALGVCFGNVVTVLSASEKQAVGEHSWGRTLWHELTHVATLTRTRNRIPRWLTEGLSVYEEPRGRPTWQRDFDREILTLLEHDLLLPVASFDQGFTKPKYPAQVMMSYYQGGMLCEFIDQTFGFEKILGLLDRYREGKDTADAVRLVFELEPEELDRRFRAYLERRYAGVAFLPGPGPEERQQLHDRLAVAPWDVAARGRLARVLAMSGAPADAEVQAGLALGLAEAGLGPWSTLAGGDAALLGLPGAWDQALARARGLRGGAGDAHLALALVAQGRGRPDAIVRHARRALDRGTRDPVTAHSLLASVARARQQWPRAIAHMEAVARLLPPTPDVQRALIALYQAAGDQARARAALRRVCELDSDDAKARLEYAGWAKEQGRWDDVAAVLDDVNLIDPFVPEAHLLLAEALRRTAAGDRAKLERALVEWTAALELDVPYKAGAHLGQAQCHLALGRRDEAKAAAARALELDPDLAEARAVLQALDQGR